MIARLRAGDAGAFDVVYAAYHARLFNFLAPVAASRVARPGRSLVAAGRTRLARDDTAGAVAVHRRAELSPATADRGCSEASHAAELIGLWPGGTPARRSRQQRPAKPSAVQRRLPVLPATYAVLLPSASKGQPTEAAAVCAISPEAMRQRLSRARALLAERLEAMPATHTPLLEVMS